MITHAFPSDITIYPIADVHLGALEFARKEWEGFVQRVESSPNTYLILAGDLLNNTTRSCRFANPLGDDIMRPREAKRVMVEYLTPIRDRLLCCVSGNHERRTIKDSDQDLCLDIMDALGVGHLYRENLAFLRLQLGQRPSEKKPNSTYIFTVAHGASNGALTGAAVNSAEAFASMIDGGLDCFVSGHVHKGFVTKPAKICIDARNGAVSMRHYTVLSCVSWLNYGGYAAQRLLRPAYTSDPQIIFLRAGSHGYKKCVTQW